MDNLTNELMKVLIRFRCSMEWAWLRLHRASSTLDASIIELDPGIDYRSRTRQFFYAAERRRLKHGVSAAGARRVAAAAVQGLDLPEQAQERARTQGLLIRRQMRVFRGLAGTAAVSMVTVVRLIVAAQAIVAILVAMALWQSPLTPPLALAAWVSTRVEIAWLADPATLVAVLLADAWLWFTMARIKRALVGEDSAPARAFVTAS
jgi:hypothetical protein